MSFATIAIDGVIGDAGERHAQPLAHRLRGQREVQLARAELGVVIEGLVEVAEPEEDDGVRVAALDVEVLAADGGEGAVHAGDCTGTECVSLSAVQLFSSGPKVGARGLQSSQ